MSSPKTVAKQISSINTMLMAGILLLAVVAVATTSFLKSTFGEYRSTSSVSTEANAVFEDIFEARMAALKWRLSAEQTHIDEFRGNVDELRQASAVLGAEGANSDELAEMVAALDGQLDVYEAEFDTMVAAQAAYTEATMAAYAAGVAARKALSEMMNDAREDGNMDALYFASRAQEALMLGRKYFETYRRTNDTGDINRAITEMESARRQLDSARTTRRSGSWQQLADDAAVQMTEFANRRSELSEALAAERQARTTLDAIGPRMIADVEGVVDAVSVRQSELGSRGDTVSMWAVVAIVAASAGIIVIGWRLSATRSRRISSDIKEAVATMTRIAEGDLDTPVDNTEHDNEIGRMARALEVFKTNGKAALGASEREKRAEIDRQKAAEAQKKEQQEQEEFLRQRAEKERKDMIAKLSASLGDVVIAASAGDFSKRVDADFADRELVTLAESVNSLVDSIEGGVSATLKTLARVAEGDLTQTMNGKFEGAFQDLQDNTNRMISSLKGLVQNIGNSATNLASSSGELRDMSDGLSRQAEQNAAAIEETSATLENLTSSIKQVDSNVSDATRHAREASETAKTSGAIAENAAHAMTRISGASREITKVVSVINDISFQINLLALNAGVEAARAGEAGRGFSVVASEVRQLAQRATEASKEIGDVITRSDSAVSEGVSTVTATQAAFEQIAATVMDVSSRIEGISATISEQAVGIGEINAAISQIDSNTQRQAAAFEEVTAAGRLLSSEADGLEKSTSRFKTAGGFDEVANQPSDEGAFRNAS